MEARTSLLERTLGVAVVNESRLLEVGVIVLAVVVPVIGLPLSIYLRRRARESGRDDYLTTLAVQISGFLLSLYAVAIAVGFFLSVMLPFWRS